MLALHALQPATDSEQVEQSLQELYLEVMMAQVQLTLRYGMVQVIQMDQT